ncbi:MAG: ABC transporter permease [Acidobacteria bacterium]|nr:ABC transporter permease [Acidobacteriota bacterium]
MSLSNSTPGGISTQGEKPAGKRRSYAAIWEAFCIAVDSIWTHKLRSVLTLLGIIIGVASVVAVGGAIEGLGSFVWQRLSSTFGSNTFTVARLLRTNVSYEEFEKIYKRNKNIYPDDMRAVEEKCEGCDAISPMIRATDEAKRGNRVVYEARVSGVNEDLPNIQSLDIEEGRFITNLDVRHARALAVIGAQIRDELFGPAEALGKDIKLGGENFTVIGVETRNGNMGGMSMDNNVYIPYTAFLKKYGTRQSIQFQVRAPSDESLESTQDEVRQILRVRHKLRPKHEDDFDILSSSAVQELVGEIFGYIAMVVTPITLISLIVGGIVVMNIMLVTVTERTVEVGTRKAVGAKRSDILLQFLIESALLASIGGIFGILVAYGACLIIESAVGFPMRITLSYVILAILTSGGIGVISGIYPAYKASKLNPIVALMRE